VLRQLNVPVYGTPLTLGLLRPKLTEHGLIADAQLNVVKPGEYVEIGSFIVEFVQVSHSIPDACALAIGTPSGTILMTGDFKIDQTPIDGCQTDLARLAQIGEDGILLLISDCTNAERPGFTPSERVVGITLDNVIRNAPGRVIIAAFASNVHRVQQAVTASERHGRKVALVGRSMEQTSETALKLGYLKAEPGTMIPAREIDSYGPDQITLITTGSQGEPLSALTRMATEEHRLVKIGDGDTVLISATPIPGNEDKVHRTINYLCRLGADVIYHPLADVHVSGHGNQEELRLMYNLCQPRYVVPTHGEPRQLRMYTRLIKEMGVADDRIIAVEIGDKLTFTEDGPLLTDKVTAGSVFVDGLTVGDVSQVILRDRWHLSQEGMVTVLVTLDKASHAVLAGPEIVSRGFLFSESGRHPLLEEALERVRVILAALSADEVLDPSVLQQDIRRNLTRFFSEKTGRRPVCLPVVMEV
ncbi:MAG: ribonuclease J, partial [Chloroflexi bacterium]|nr:ribonuclease J [Chloroflexota bacterium]